MRYIPTQALWRGFTFFLSVMGEMGDVVKPSQGSPSPGNKSSFHDEREVVARTQLGILISVTRTDNIENVGREILHP